MLRCLRSLQYYEENKAHFLSFPSASIGNPVSKTKGKDKSKKINYFYFCLTTHVRVIFGIAPKLLKPPEARQVVIARLLPLRIPAGEARRPGGVLLRRVCGLQFGDLWGSSICHSQMPVLGIHVFKSINRKDKHKSPSFYFG